MLRRLLDSPWLYFGLAALLLVVAVATTMLDYRGSGRPTGGVEELAALRDRDDVNVLFILVDTLRADHLSVYGYERETSPYIDNMASQGIVFKHVQAQSTWTKTSMASMWTASYPERTGVLRFDHAVPEEPTLPAEIFKGAGYTTAGIVRNGWVEANFGFGQGFDIYLMPHPVSTPGRFQSFNPSSAPLQGSDENLTVAALEFLRSHGKEKFFLYVHYMDAHQYSYDGASGLFGATGFKDAYDNAIHWTDRNIGGLLRELRDQGLLDETIVVLAADHGEAFLEHGSEGHARNLYNEVTHTPWIISLPFALEEQVVVEPTVANVDIWPTMLDMLGLPAMEDTDGHSVLPLIEAAMRGEAPPPDGERPIFAQLDKNWGNTDRPSEPLIAVTRPPYRFLYNVEKDRPELYDRSKDPTEQDNLAGDMPDVTQGFEKEVEAYFDDASRHAWDAPEVHIDEMRRRQLKALGYVEDKGPKDHEEAR